MMASSIHLGLKELSLCLFLFLVSQLVCVYVFCLIAFKAVDGAVATFKCQGWLRKLPLSTSPGMLRPQTLPFRVQITRAKPAQSVKFPAPAAIKEQIQASGTRSLARKYYKVSVFPEIYPASFRHHVAARGLSFSRLRRSMPASWL
jgi:hypothetical protein